jgi:hypothetical protein
MMTISLQKLKRRDNDGKQWPTGEEESSAAHDDTSRGGDDNNGQMTLFGGSVSKSPGRERNNERPFDHSNNNKPQRWRKWTLRRPSKSRPTSPPIRPSDDNNALVLFTAGSVSKSPARERMINKRSSGHGNSNKRLRWSKWPFVQSRPRGSTASSTGDTAEDDSDPGASFTGRRRRRVFSSSISIEPLLPTGVPLILPGEVRNEIAVQGKCSVILCLPVCLPVPACLLLVVHGLPQTNHNTQRT